jgi:hypothetical protein
MHRRQAMNPGVRLNLFQRMMLRWRDLHPYNPVHAVQVPRPLDAPRLRTCIAQRLEAFALTGLVVDRSRWRLRYEGGPAQVDLTVTVAGSDMRQELSRTIEREFNRPFPQGPRENPFRFVAIDEGGAFQLVLAYDHYVAGGDSIARLLGAIACAYLGADDVPATTECRSPTYRHLFLRRPLWALRSVLGLRSMVASARRSYRVRIGDAEDGRNAFSYLRVDPATKAALLATAKAWGVTLNELLMASVLKALAPLAAQRRTEPRRNQLAVASILNMRGDFGGDAMQALSPFLAAFRVVHDVPDGIGLRQLALDVHGAVLPIRRDHLYLQSIVALAASALLWPWLPDAKRHLLYPKHFPVWAGITSLNLDPLWARGGVVEASRLDYLRAVPTGPLCPLVFAVTSAHDVLHIGIAYRTAAFARADVERVVAGVVQCLGELQPDGAE